MQRRHAGRAEVYIHPLSSALHGGEWSSSLPGRFNPGERTPGTHPRWGRAGHQPVRAFWRREKSHQTCWKSYHGSFSPWVYNPRPAGLYYAVRRHICKLCVGRKKNLNLKFNIEARSCNYCCSGKAISITYCVCSLSYPARNAHAPYCHLWHYLALKYSFTLSHKRHDYRRKDTEHKMRILTFSTTSVWNIPHPKKKCARYGQKCLLVFM